MTTTTTVRGVLSTLPKTLLMLAAIAAAAVCGPQASAATVGAFMYGVDNDNSIWEINPADKTATKVLTSTDIGQTANSLAYDTTRNQLFFVNGVNAFNYWERSTNTVRSVGGVSLGLTSDPNNAAYFENAFYYFEHNSNVLKRANLSYSGSGETAVPSVASIDSFAILGMDLPITSGPNTNSFGDIAINTATGTLYASTSRGRFYSLDLTNPTASFDEIVPSAGNNRTVGLQLAFNASNGTLYGANYDSGNWFTIDPATGVATQISGFNTLVAGGRSFRDLGGSAINAVPEPSTIGLAAIGLVGGLGYTGLRRRQKTAKAAA